MTIPRQTQARELSPRLYPAQVKNRRIFFRIIYPSPVTKDTFPTSRITSGFKLSPMIKRRMAMPSLAKSSMYSVDLIRFRKYGPAIIPLKIYPTMSGCLRSLIIKDMTVAITKISPISIKISILRI